MGTTHFLETDLLENGKPANIISKDKNGETKCEYLSEWNIPNKPVEKKEPKPVLFF